MLKWREFKVLVLDQKKQAEIITEQEEELWKKGLLGNSTHESLLNTVIFYNRLYFTLRSGKVASWGIHHARYNLLNSQA